MKLLQEMLAISEGRDGRHDTHHAWKILLHPGGGGGKAPYPEDQVAALVKTLSRGGNVAKVLRSTAKNLEIALTLAKPNTEDAVWDLIGDAPVDAELEWGGSVRPDRAGSKAAASAARVARDDAMLNGLREWFHEVQVNPAGTEMDFFYDDGKGGYDFTVHAELDGFDLVVYQPAGEDDPNGEDGILVDRDLKTIADVRKAVRKVTPAWLKKNKLRTR